ncbi:MAG TPA: hypothetical protein VNJ07_11930 [Chitinophagales bacterium]|nr:hypothetical protein [Chitinophagales bacterium]
MITLLFFLFFFQAGFLFAQKVNITEVCKLDKALQETSGIVISGGKIWSHNDSGAQPVLYGFDNSGKVSTIIYVSAKNTDWEDLAKDDAGNIYIGDFGNEKNKRHDLKIFRIPNPQTLNETIVKPEVIEFNYADQKLFPPDTNAQNFDMEAMLWFNNHLYLFSKNRTNPFTGYSKVYRLPDKAGSYTAELIDSVYLGPAPMITSWVTSADISPDKKKVVLLGHDKIWLFTCFESDRFFSGKKYTIALSTPTTQKEAVCFKNDNELYITDELVMRVLGGKLYSLDLSGVKIENCK